MSRAYVNLIIAGRRKYSTVPTHLKEEVKAGLEAAVGEKRITSEKLAELLAA